MATENPDQNAAALTNLFRTDMDSISISLQLAVPPENAFFACQGPGALNSRGPIALCLTVLVRNINS